jgi:hypothetical protein
MHRTLIALCAVAAACSPPAPSPDAALDGATHEAETSAARDVSTDSTRASDGAALDAQQLADGQSDAGDDEAILDAHDDASIDRAAPLDVTSPDATSDNDATRDATSVTDGSSPGDAASATDAMDASDSSTDSALPADAARDAAPPDASVVGVVDYTARGYFQRGRVPPLTPGIPAGYVARPAGMTYSELAQLQQDCVDRINAYRAGALTFTGGGADPGVPRASLAHLMGNNRCSSAAALGDMVVNSGGGSLCAGASTNAFSCPFAGSAGQNSCCLRTASSYAQVRTQLFACLQSLWDEGVGQPNNAPFSTAIGHWFTMRNSALTQVSCGFAFDDRGRVWMTQDFSGARPASVAQTCSCVTVGGDDGCGGVCVAPP